MLLFRFVPEFKSQQNEYWNVMSFCYLLFGMNFASILSLCHLPLKTILALGVYDTSWNIETVKVVLLIFPSLMT